jgi:hypothetical protein
MDFLVWMKPQQKFKFRVGMELGCRYFYFENVVSALDFIQRRVLQHAIRISVPLPFTVQPSSALTGPTSCSIVHMTDNHDEVMPKETLYLMLHSHLYIPYANGM